MQRLGRLTLRFPGFQRGTLYTPVPNPLLGPLLEDIQDLAELKVTLRGLWLLHRKRGQRPPRTLSMDDFLNDRTLLRGLNVAGRDPRDEIRRGLRLAVARQSFLVYQPDPNLSAGPLYLLNDQWGRQFLSRQIHGPTAAAGGAPEQPETAATDTVVEPPELDGQPNIFALYEDNVGMLSPMLADQLIEAEQLYPGHWITEAFQIAVSENKRNWRYINSILRRWADEGKDHGKPERHPPADDRRKYIAEYQRRRGHLPWERDNP